MVELALHNQTIERVNPLTIFALKRALSESDWASSFFQRKLFGPGQTVLELKGGKPKRISNTRFPFDYVLPSSEAENREDLPEAGLVNYARDVMNGKEINSRYSNTEFVLPINVDDFNRIASEIHSLSDIRLDSRNGDNISLKKRGSIDDFLYRMITFSMPDGNGVYDVDLSVVRRNLELKGPDHKNQVCYVFDRTTLSDNNTDPTLSRDPNKIIMSSSRHIVSGIREN